MRICRHILCFLFGSLGAPLAMSAPAWATPEHCQPDISYTTSVSQGYIVNYNICAFEIEEDIRLFWGENGVAYGEFENLEKALQAQDLRLVFAMNAGMYHPDRSPVGLYVENGQHMSSLQLGASYGNFGLVPNGVFYRAGENFGVMETKAFHAAGVKPDFASQSGPMLVVNGQLHPKFKKGSNSKRIRNGVGISRDAKVLYFVKSDVPMNFHSFASIFKDQLKVDNALYLDGTISRVYDSERGLSEGGAKMGPIVGIVAPKREIATHINNAPQGD